MSVIETTVPVSDFKDEEMREVAVGEGKALLIKQNGQFSAIGHACSHFGAPLKNGVLHNGTVRCPWHGACFSATTGDIEDFPGLDGVKSFKVRVDGSNVVISATEEELKSAKRTLTMCPKSNSDNRVTVLIGGGGGNASAAEALRQSGYTGRIILVSKEPYLPYDRTKLSKALNSTGDSLALRNREFYSQHGVELLLGVTATELVPDQKTVTLSNGETIKYDFAVVGTGSSPRTLNVPGADLKGIYVLRSPEDGATITAEFEGKNVVIIGSSFIGLEVAAALVKKSASTTVLGREETPFTHIFGPQIGTLVKKLHESNNVKFQGQAAIKSFEGQNGKVTAVNLESGASVPADIVVLGVGSSPNTEFIRRNSGVTIAADNSVVTDQYGHAGHGLYAVGDVARFPYAYATAAGATIRAEHFQIAEYLGSVAGKNIAGKQTAITTVPYFWTAHYGKSIRYAGHVDKAEEVILHGDLEAQKFAAFYVQGGKVVAVASMAADPIVSRFASLLTTNSVPTPDEIRNKAPSAAWTLVA